MLVKINGTVFNTKQAVIQFYDHILKTNYSKPKPGAPDTIRAASVTVGGNSEYSGFNETFYGKDAEELETLVGNESDMIIGNGVQINDFLESQNDGDGYRNVSNGSPALTHNFGLSEERMAFLDKLVEDQPINKPFPENLLREMNLTELSYVETKNAEVIGDIVRADWGYVTTYPQSPIVKASRFLVQTYQSRDAAINIEMPAPTESNPEGKKTFLVFLAHSWAIRGEWIEELKTLRTLVEAEQTAAQNLRDANARDKLIKHLQGKEGGTGYSQTWGGDDIPF